MNRIYILITLLLATLIMSGNSFSQEEYPILKGPYFGQKTPDLVPNIFAPDSVSVDGRYDGGVTFSPDLNEMYFSTVENGKSVVYFSKLVNKKWSKLKKANFTKGKASEEFSAIVSSNGERIYFSTYDEKYPLKIWAVNRLEDSWGEAMLLDSPINSEEVIIMSEAKNGDIFYINSSKGKMYYAPNKNGGFPEGLEVEIDSGSHGFISPSQDFLLVSAHKENDKKKDKDIYIYFKKKNGAWSKAISVGNAINTSYREDGPTITPDGKYLFFSRYDGTSGSPNVYWVSIEIINEIKLAYFKTQ